MKYIMEESAQSVPQISKPLQAQNVTKSRNPVLIQKYCYGAPVKRWAQTDNINFAKITDLPGRRRHETLATILTVPTNQLHCGRQCMPRNDAVVKQARPVENACNENANEKMKERRRRKVEAAKYREFIKFHKKVRRESPHNMFRLLANDYGNAWHRKINERARRERQRKIDLKRRIIEKNRKQKGIFQIKGKTCGCKKLHGWARNAFNT